MNEERKIWEQNIEQGEPDLWYGRFVKFMRLGTRRSINAVYAQEKKEKQGKASTKIGPEWLNAAKQWKWEERARKYDEHERAEEDRIIAEERDKVMRSGLALQHKRIQLLDRLSQKLVKMADDNDEQIWIPETRTTTMGQDRSTSVDKVTFNHHVYALIDKYQDSIAKEMGERVKKQEVDVTTNDAQEIQTLHEAIAQALEQYPEAKIALAERLAENEQSG